MENDSSVEQKHRLNSQHILTFSMKRKYLLFTIDFQTEFTLSWNFAKIKSIYLQHKGHNAFHKYRQI